MLAIILYSILCLNRNFISLRGAKLLPGNPRPTHAGTVTGALNYQQPISNFSLFAVICRLNPRTYAQPYPHRGTMGREGGGGGWLGLLDPSPISILPSVGKPSTFSTTRSIFYAWWRCWRPVTSPNIVAILYFFKNWKSGKNSTINNFLRLTSETTHKYNFASFYPEGFLLFQKEVEKHAFSL